MAVKSSVQAVPLTSLSSAFLTAAYDSINSAGLPQSCFLLKIVSTSTTGVTISYDGVTDHDYLPAGLTMEVNAQTNSQPNNWIANFQKGTVVWVKGTAGTGNIYVVGYFQPQSSNS
jgi:hypothetical protein